MKICQIAKAKKYMYVFNQPTAHMIKFGVQYNLAIWQHERMTYVT